MLNLVPMYTCFCCQESLVCTDGCVFDGKPNFYERAEAVFNRDTDWFTVLVPADDGGQPFNVTLCDGCIEQYCKQFFEGDKFLTVDGFEFFTWFMNTMERFL